MEILEKLQKEVDEEVEKFMKLLINEDKSSNIEVKSNNLPSTLTNEEKVSVKGKCIEKQIEEMARTLCGEKEQSCAECEMCYHCEFWCECSVLHHAGYRKLPENIGEFSDGYHTFNELYHHRAILFSVICNMFPEKAWKSKLHDTGDMFDGMFIVGIETEQGQATYHYDIEPYWDMFKVKELEKAPKWDGHTPSDAIQRIGNIKQSEGEWNDNIIGFCNVCMNCGAIVERSAIKNNSGKLNFCPNCGSKMKGGE
jgi:hypothetical protein